MRKTSIKGYESINRDFIQDSNLSLEAIGLMVNIKSYADSWVLHKTELYTRFAKNGRTSVDRSWDELVRNGYILQFRKREGKSYNYQYYTSTEKVEKEEALMIAEKMKAKGFDFYHKEAKHFKSFNLSSLIDMIFGSEEKVERTRFAEREQVDFEEIINQDTAILSSSVESVQSKLESSNRASNRLITKKFTKKIEEEDIYNNNIDFSIPAIKTAAAQLLNFDLDINDVNDVLVFLSEQQELDVNAMNQQFNWMVIKANDDTGIASFSSYFKNGYIKRVNNSSISNINVKESSVLPKVPMFNWLKGENMATV